MSAFVISTWNGRIHVSVAYGPKSRGEQLGTEKCRIALPRDLESKSLHDLSHIYRLQLNEVRKELWG